MTKKIFWSGIIYFLRLQQQFPEEWGHMPPSPPVPTALIAHAFLQSVSNQFHVNIIQCNSTNVCQRIFRYPLPKTEI